MKLVKKSRQKRNKHALYTVTGVVRHRSGRGTTLGYPTANLSLAHMMESAISVGIYAGYVEFNQQVYQAAIFVGAAETFGETEVQLEAYLLDFEGDMYNASITVELIQKIRDHKKFSSADALHTAITQDIIETRQCLQEL